MNGLIEPIQLTETLENTILVSWTPDSRAVIVEQDIAGNERAQLFRITLDKPLKMESLTEANPNYFIRGGQLHPNGRWLVYGANFDATTGEETEATWIYRHDLKTGEKLALAKPLKPCYIHPYLNHQGSYILYCRSDLHPAGRQIWLVDIEGGIDREILNFGSEVKTFARWFPDGQHAVVIVEIQTHRRLGIWNLENEKMHWLLDDSKRDIAQAYVPHGSDKVVIVQNHTGRTQSSLLDQATGREITLPEMAGNLIPLAPVPQTNEDWTGYFFASNQPHDVVRFSLSDPNLENFTSISRVWQHTTLKSDGFVRAEDYQWTSGDGLKIHGWLYRAKEPVSGTLVYVHGGPSWHSPDWINAQIQLFANQGFNVLEINYRGSTGYGLPFREAIKEGGWGGREMEDIRTGIEALIEAGIAQPGKIGITGTSYGGYASWWAITHFPPEIVAAAALICGMTDLVVDYETTRPDLRPYSAEMMGGTPAEVSERFFERSPIYFVQYIRGDLLIIQGAQDPNVTPQNLTDVVRRLDAAGILYQTLVFEDEGHGISKRENQRVLLLRMLSFFREAFGIA